MIKNSFNDSRLFESISRLNECGGGYVGFGGCGGGGLIFDDDYYERQRINRERREKNTKRFTSKFMKDIGQDDPDYNYSIADFLSHP